MTHIPLTLNFIDQMQDTNPVYSVLYIHAIHLAYAEQAAGHADQPGRVKLCTKAMAKTFKLTEADVVAAFQHWQANRLVHLTFGEELSVDFIAYDTTLVAPATLVSEPVSTTKPAIVASPVSVPDMRSELKIVPPLAVVPAGEPLESHAPVAAPVLNLVDPTQKPEYLPAEIEVYREGSPVIAELFKKVETVMGKYLKSTDLSTVFGFYDWLELPFDVIGLLLDYCEQAKYRNINYIEKIAIDWSEQGINTAEAATAYIDRVNKSYRGVLKAIGLSGQDNVTASQKKYIDKWLTQYNLSMELVENACDKAVMATGKPSFAYVDKILAAWFTAGVTTLEQVAQLDKDHSSKPATNKPLKRTASKFNNFSPAPMDHDSLDNIGFELIQSSSGF